MKAQKSQTATHCSDRAFTIQPKAFVFFDRKTGTRRFEVKANEDGSLPFDHATSLLAAQCVMRGQTPGEFSVLVAADEEILDGLEKHTEKIILDCKMFQTPTLLTKREQEVLREVLQVSTNKEIANKVHISVRTVKFHISALLAKFGAASRMDLMRKTTDLYLQQENSNETALPVLVAGPKHGSGLGVGRADDQPVCANGLDKRSCRWPRGKNRAPSLSSLDALKSRNPIARVSND